MNGSPTNPSPAANLSPESPGHPRPAPPRRTAHRSLPAPGNVVLIGFMGTGKTTVGRLLAKKLRLAFLDLDRVIVDRTGYGIPTIFAQRGEEGFRAEETAALQGVRTRTHTVIATGGGIVTRPANFPLLADLGFVVWLRATEEVVFDRVSRSKRRPLLETADPRATICRLLAERDPLYAAAAHYVLDTSDQPHAVVADTIAAAAHRFYAARPPAAPAPQ